MRIEVAVYRLASVVFGVLADKDLHFMIDGRIGSPELTDSKLSRLLRVQSLGTV
jgi:hypothetical protein